MVIYSLFSPRLGWKESSFDLMPAFCPPHVRINDTASRIINHTAMCPGLRQSGFVVGWIFSGPQHQQACQLLPATQSPALTGWPKIQLLRCLQRVNGVISSWLSSQLAQWIASGQATCFPLVSALMFNLALAGAVHHRPDQAGQADADVFSNHAWSHRAPGS